MTDGSIPDKDDTNDDDSSIAALVAGLEPMGDLSRFVIHDLTPEQEEAFFSILRGA